MRPKVMGDGAFGFSAMEYEVITRYRMNALIIILNNGGITGGPREWKESWDEVRASQCSVGVVPVSCCAAMHV